MEQLANNAFTSKRFILASIMENPSLPSQSPFNDARILALTEKHLQEWLQLQERMRSNLTPAEEMVVCEQQVTRLQNDLRWLRSNA